MNGSCELNREKKEFGFVIEFYRHPLAVRFCPQLMKNYILRRSDVES